MAQFVQQTSNVSAAATGSTAGTALAANPARVFFKIQNVGANPIYLLYGIGNASATNFHEILAAGVAALDGTGGIVQSTEVCYQGRIAVGGTAAAFVAYENTP